MKILVLHGPNLNLFGRREPHIYGSTTLAEINERLGKLAAELGVELETIQSNHEGELIDFLHQHIDEAQGALVNPAGLTQHGVPLHDAIKAMPFPVFEVHMSNIAAREAGARTRSSRRRSRARSRGSVRIRTWPACVRWSRCSARRRPDQHESMDRPLLRRH